MLIVVTGLDGSGTSSVARKLHEMDDGSYLFHTPGDEYSDRKSIDHFVKSESKVAHMLYYLSSDVYLSDYIKNNCDYKNHNVYVVRYLIDTVVSNRVAGTPIDLDYNVYGNQLLEPDLTIFVQLDEEKRQERILRRGKDNLDSILDDEIIRNRFLEEFNNFLIPEKTIYVSNDRAIEDVALDTYKKIKKV